MRTLKYLKGGLNKISDEILERCFWGIGEGSEERVGLWLKTNKKVKVGNNDDKKES